MNAIDPGLERSSINETPSIRRMKVKGGSSPKILIEPKEDPPPRRSGHTVANTFPNVGINGTSNQVG